MRLYKTMESRLQGYEFKVSSEYVVQFVAYDCLKTGLAILDPATIAAARL